MCLQLSSFYRRPIRSHHPANHVRLFQKFARHVDRRVAGARRAGLNLSDLILVDDVPDHLARRQKLWVIRVEYIAPPAWWRGATASGLVGSAAPDGTAKCGPATRIAVKPCACGAPQCGFGAVCWACPAAW